MGPGPSATWTRDNYSHLHLTHIKIGVNKSNTLFIVNLDYEFCNKKKIFLKQYDLDKSDLDKSYVTFKVSHKIKFKLMIMLKINQFVKLFLTYS